MKLDYKIEVEEFYNQFRLKIIILKQDERFWKKEYDNNEDFIEYKCKNGFIIRSHRFVLLCLNKIHLNGFSDYRNYDSLSLHTLEELNEYKQKLIEALEEFKAYEPDETNKKPEIGIVPKHIYYNQIEQQRLKDLKECIKRRIDNDDSLLMEWIEEYNDLITPIN